MEKNYKLLFAAGAALMLSFYANSYAQCVQINCPANIVQGNDAGACGAVVTYAVPTAVDLCSIDTATFNFTNAIETWTVPAGVTSITIRAKGAQGGYNTSSSTQSGLGADMTGTFAVTPGMQLKILVGEQPSSNAGNGGGGGTFVTDMSNNPLIIAGGGGGSSESTDSPNKHGQSGTSGGLGAAGGGAGGTAGSGGSIGASGFQSGAGGGLLTSGADGWTVQTGGSAFIIGGAGAPTNAPARGGFGGGGSGSSYVVGGGGGGYSGGGSGGNSSGGVGGGGGSFNNGTAQNNMTGMNAGHGSVMIIYGSAGSATVSLISGLSSGSTFPVGNTVQTFVADNGLGDTDTCSFTVTVNDTEGPGFNTCPANVETCNTSVSGIAAVAGNDNCPGSVTVTYTLTGATTGSGTSSDASGIFNVGITTVTYFASDATGNTDSCSLTVTVFPTPSATADAADTLVCVTAGAVALTGTPAGGTWSGTGVTGNSFAPSTGVGTYTLTYSYTNGDGCSDSATVQMTVIGCAGIEDEDNLDIQVYPNPAQDVVNIAMDQVYPEINVKITDMTGKQIMQKIYTDTKMISVPVNGMAAGTYFIHIDAGTVAKIKRVIKL